MKDYCQVIKKRGQIFKVQGKRCAFTIDNPHPQKGGPPTIGINDQILDEAIKHNWTFYIHIKSLNKTYEISPFDWLKSSKKEEQPSYYGIPWYIYRGPIPKLSAPTAREPMTEDERIRESYYKYHLYG